MEDRMEDSQEDRIEDRLEDIIKDRMEDRVEDRWLKKKVQTVRRETALYDNLYLVKVRLEFIQNRVG